MNIWMEREIERWGDRKRRTKMRRNIINLTLILFYMFSHASTNYIPPQTYSFICVVEPQKELRNGFPCECIHHFPVSTFCFHPWLSSYFQYILDPNHHRSICIDVPEIDEFVKVTQLRFHSSCYCRLFLILLKMRPTRIQQQSIPEFNILSLNYVHSFS